MSIRLFLVLRVILHRYYFTIYFKLLARSRQATLDKLFCILQRESWKNAQPGMPASYSYSTKLRCNFKKGLGPFLIDNMRWLPQPKNSSIHSMFALQGSGFTPVVAQACHLNKNPIQFEFSHCKHLLKRHGKFINRCNRTILIW